MKNRRTLSRVGPVLVAAGLCLSAAALADELPTITIGAGVTSKSVIGHSPIGTPLEQVTISYRVSYADLDLRTVIGATELRNRVKQAARAACRQLDDLYPLEESNAKDCTRTAIANASPQVENAIAAATREANAE